MNPDVLFCHGLESHPHGPKYQAMVANGLSVHAPDCRKQHLPRRIEILTDAMLEQRPAVVVGSSFGGIAGLIAALRAVERGLALRGLLLCAPALMLPVPTDAGVRLGCPARTILLHGRRDDIIPIALSRDFARLHGAELVEVDDEHRLEASLPRMLDLIRGLLA